MAAQLPPGDQCHMRGQVYQAGTNTARYRQHVIPIPDDAGVIQSVSVILSKAVEERNLSFI